MANLAQLSRIESERGRAALATLLEAAPYLRFLDRYSGFEEKGTSFLYYLVNGAATLQRRALAGEYTPDDRTPPTAQDGSLAFLGDSIDVDRSHRADEERGLLNIENWIDTELGKSVRKFAKLVDAELFNGSGAGSPRQVKGLKTILDGTTDVPGFPGGTTMVIDAVDYGTGDSFDLSTPNNYDAFLEAFELWVSLVDDAKAVVVNKELGARLTTIARVKHIIGESRDQFGRPIPTINGIEILRLPSTVIGNAEPDNAGTPVNETTSMYIEDPGEGKRSVVTNSGLQFDDLGTLEGKESERVKWEMRCDNVIQEDSVIRRVRNIKLG